MVYNIINKINLHKRSWKDFNCNIIIGIASYFISLWWALVVIIVLFLQWIAFLCWIAFFAEIHRFQRHWIILFLFLFNFLHQINYVGWEQDLPITLEKTTSLFLLNYFRIVIRSQPRMWIRNFSWPFAIFIFKINHQLNHHRI